MKLKGILNTAAVLLTAGTFYTFSLCMVQDIDENTISAEYYLSEETEAAETEPVVIAPKETKPVTSAVTVTSETTVTTPEETEETTEAETKAELAARAEVTEAAVVTEAPVTEIEAEVTAAASDDDFGVEELGEDPYSFDYIDGLDVSDEENIEDAETEVYSETTVPETTTAETTADTYDEIFLSLWGNSFPDTTAETTETSVSVNMGGNASTSETFTAKFNGSTQTVNAYDLICKIVANEMSPSFSDEAIKAQAVAAYSYVKYHNVNGLTPSVLVREPSDRIKQLVSEVWGVCCYYNGSVAQTVYMASSSGYTADAKNVWGGSVPYLKSVSCPFDAEYDPNYGDTMKVSESSMRDKLESSLGITLSPNPYNWLVIQSFVDGNYVYELSVDGQKTISGRKLRENVMGHKLKSAAFDVYYSDGYFYFTTYGYGHGVGMSQNGANILAKQGYSYSDILKYYFTGIEVQ